MTPEEFAAAMQKIATHQERGYDEEPRHADADGLMMQVLSELGYGEGVEIFSEMPKWYA
jgi:hypothetical protein